MKRIYPDELKKIQIDIILHINEFCQKHNIRYFICGGTLIGAIRHQGFIPWDDDIDIMMLREDYERFIHIYSSEDKSKYKLHSHKLNKQYPYPYVKIDDSETVFEEEIKDTFRMGVNIDLFPIDIIPESKNKQRVIYRKSHLYIQMLTLKRLPLIRRRGIWKNLLLFIMHSLMFFISNRYIINSLDKIATKYRNERSSLCGVVVWGYGMREINKLDNYRESIYVPFESIKLPIPNGYDIYLRNLYGNYMELPPIEKRVSHHHFIAYRKY